MGVEYRYPLLDQRVVEFALALPPEQYRGAGMSRRVFREALANSFPQALRSDVSKQEPQRVQEIYDILVAVIKQQLLASPPAENPWIDVRALQREASALPEPGTPPTEDALNALLRVKRALMVAELKGDMPLS